MWIYTLPQVRPDSGCPVARFTVHDCRRIPFSGMGLREHRFALSLVGALLRTDDERLSAQIAPIDMPADLGSRLVEAGAAVAGSGIIEAMVTSAAVLESWQFWDGYRAIDHLRDMTNNGLVVLLATPQ
ncbi:hypothetical protein [Catellatospora methionotrophica]|uniref:hypothetical protein n=1 Tax=Catellatospora methionotrophica TaxID=121620 RepID=UPI0033F6A75C